MHFKFSPSILSRLGEELIPNPDQGILELVKNAYDADATWCKVELLDTESKGGTIIVSDNGMGMDMDILRDGWLTIGKSEKESAQERTSLGRLRVGSKGLGRLAALRQGTNVKLITRPKNQPNIEYSVSICWSDFDTTESVENVVLTPEVNQTSSEPGTEIIIINLKDKLGKCEVKRLALELLLLADPFDTEIAFRPKLIGTGFEDLEKQVNEAFFDDAEFRLRASLDESGYATAELFDWKDSTIASASHSDIIRYRKQLDVSERLVDEGNLAIETPYQTVPASFELWIFQLNPQSFSIKNRPDNSSQIRKWLKSVGGVHLYHRGLRVAPYGDEGDDWLKINLSRARNPQVRPSTSTVIGRVIAEDDNNELLQKTDRLGFLENDAFLNLQQFSMNVLDWVADVRLKTVEAKREQVKREVKPQIFEARQKVEEIITINIPEPAPRKQVLLVVENYEKVRDEEVKSLNEELQLYRSLATAGTTAAVFAHESGRDITTLKQETNLLKSKIKSHINNDSDFQPFLEILSRVQKLTDSIQKFVKYPIYLLNRDKRRYRKIEIHEVIDQVSNLFSHFLENADIDIEIEKADSALYFQGSTALMEAILVNLITNAINAFNVQGAPIEHRKVLIHTASNDGFLCLRVMDNALGIKGTAIDDIWLPGKTTTPSGTGLGLKIARDSVADLGGKIDAIANGQLGGAEFIVKLPLK